MCRLKKDCTFNLCAMRSQKQHGVSMCECFTGTTVLPHAKISGLGQSCEFPQTPITIDHVGQVKSCQAVVVWRCLDCHIAGSLWPLREVSFGQPQRDAKHSSFAQPPRHRQTIGKYWEHLCQIFPKQCDTVASGADFQNIKVQNLSEPIRFSLLVDPNRDSWRLRILRRGGSVDTMTMSQDNYIESPMKRGICTILTSHLPQWYFRKTWPKFFSGCGQRIGTCNL